MNLNLGVIGLGKLGSPMVAALASKGFTVTGCDVDSEKVKALNEGRAPVDETGLGDLLFANRQRVRAVSDIGETVRNSDITFVVTATPSKPDGRFSLEYILPVCEEIGYALRAKSKQAFHIVVITSTVMPGDTWGPIREIIEKASGRKAGESFGLCYSPEFIALGSVIHDFLNPDFVLLGASDPLSDARVTSVYRTFTDAPIARMSTVNAEITKIAVNSYITTKISFANMLSRICTGISGADVDVVTGAMGLDSRIGKKYLKGGVSYGGPCFPRDNRALATLGEPELPEVVDSLNHGHTGWIIDQIRKRDLKGSFTVLGRSYKVGTEVDTESPGNDLIHFLELHDYLIAHSYLGDVVITMLPDPKYKEFNYSGKTVIDPWRFQEYLKNDESVNYIPLGIGPRE